MCTVARQMSFWEPRDRNVARKIVCFDQFTFLLCSSFENHFLFSKSRFHKHPGLSSRVSFFSSRLVLHPKDFTNNVNFQANADPSSPGGKHNFV